MITSKYYCNVTKKLDELMAFDTEGHKNYILDDKLDNLISIRYVGATRGHIEFSCRDNQTIKEIVLYEDSIGVYDKEKALEAMKSFIGSKLIITEKIEMFLR